VIGSPWYLVHTQAFAEMKAASHLRRQGFSIYLPRYLKRRSHARRVETIAAPLFPRYMFVVVDQMTQRWRSIHSTVGVNHLVCNGDEPAIVPPGIISELRAREDEHGFIRLDIGSQFKPGDKVRVVDGAFHDCLGIFERVTDRERVAILLDLLGRKVRVVLDEHSLAIA